MFTCALVHSTPGANPVPRVEFKDLLHISKSDNGGLKNLTGKHFLKPHGIGAKEHSLVSYKELSQARENTNSVGEMKSTN